MTVIHYDFRPRSDQAARLLSSLRRVVDAIEADVAAHPTMDLDGRSWAIAELKAAITQTQHELKPRPRMVRRMG